MEKLIVKKVTDLQTSKGDSYKKIDVMKTDGTIVAGVSAFQFKYPNLAELVEGAEINAMIVLDGNYKNLVSAVPKPARRGIERVTNGEASIALKTVQIEKVMEKKEQSIGKFQDNKEFGIKVSSTMRMAVDIATSLTVEQWHSTTMQEEIIFWREWLWQEWDAPNTNPLYPN